MRGKGQAAPFGAEPVGITPAYAGKSSAPRITAGRLGDHPRICGEKENRLKKRWRLQGSPPHMRGKVLQTILSGTEIGITPAYAGKSFSESLRSGLLRDHPRICGEKILEGAGWTLGVGSPPHMRGKGARLDF